MQLLCLLLVPLLPRGIILVVLVLRRRKWRGLAGLRFSGGSCRLRLLSSRHRQLPFSGPKLVRGDHHHHMMNAQGQTSHHLRASRLSHGHEPQGR